MEIFPFGNRHPIRSRELRASKGAISMLSEIIWNQNTLAVAGVFAVPIIAIAAHYWSEVQKRRSDNNLKRSMIERGMPPEEIERVLSAKVETR